MENENISENVQNIIDNLPENVTVSEIIEKPSVVIVEFKFSNANV